MEARRGEARALILALTLATGMWRGEITYLALILARGAKHAMKALVPQAQGTKGGSEPQVGVPAVTEVLSEFEDLLPMELPKELSPRHEVDHKIDLVPGVVPLGRPPYRMASVELAELQHQLDELVVVGFIWPFTSPYGTSVLFQRKKDWSLQMFVDYWAFNQITI